MVTLGITHSSEWNQYRVYWKDGDVYNEDKSSYTDSTEDAVDNLVATYRWAKSKGIPVRISSSKYTTKLIEKYRPEFGESESTEQGNFASGGGI